MGDVIHYVISVSIDYIDDEKYDIVEVIKDSLDIKGIDSRVSVYQQTKI